ncbi:MAG: ABC transporter substrate-binding protein [Betaproteobacteria bacterium]
MRRRTALALGGALLAQPFLGLAQPAKPFRVGWLAPGTREGAEPFAKAFVSGMLERGYVLGSSFIMKIKTADGFLNRLPALARQLVASQPDVILAYETTARVLVPLTSTIPIVLTSSIDPVAVGLVKSLARPETNVTGMVDQFDQLVAKHVDLMVEVAPKTTHVLLLLDRSWSALDSFEKFGREAAEKKGLKLTAVSPEYGRGLREVFENVEKLGRVGLIVTGSGGVLVTLAREIIDRSLALRLPTVFAFGFFAERGGLIGYGPNLPANFREAADFVARIVAGAKPAELPLRLTKKFDLVVNAGTAKAIGVTIPQSVLLRADRVIE